MSKFEELCQAYAIAKQNTEATKKACKRFADGFTTTMSNYFQTPIEKQQESFDKNGLMHFETALTLYQDLKDKENYDSEIVVIFWSVENILDNYILTLYPWMNEYKLFENELDKFEEIYQHIFEIIKETYQSPIILSQEEKNTIRNLGW
ncbi:MAG: hypothetical protein AB4057_10480 [Crocosphaera sp.]